jgi:probable aminopeptidase NPEPL1
MKNSVACRTNAQSACAGQFIGNHIEAFLADGGAWLHIDMAYPAVAQGRATGYGVALLATLGEDLLS